LEKKDSLFLMLGILAKTKHKENILDLIDEIIYARIC
jgi:hypothetical protein